MTILRKSRQTQERSTQGRPPGPIQGALNSGCGILRAFMRAARLAARSGQGVDLLRVASSFSEDAVFSNALKQLIRLKQGPHASFC
jgi:hypothetical protein